MAGHGHNLTPSGSGSPSRSLRGTLYDDADYMACCRLPKPESLVICGAAYLKSDPEITLRLVGVKPQLGDSLLHPGFKS